MQQSDNHPARVALSAVILAGGRAERMQGRTKGLQALAGRSLIEHVLDRLLCRVDELLINTNQAHAYAHLGLAQIADLRPDQPGPLAGVEAGLTAARNPLVLFVPCDTPMLPPSLISRLLNCQQSQGAAAVVAHDGHRRQNGVLLLQRQLLDDLRAYLNLGGHSVHGWLDRLRPSECDFSDLPSAFVNINTLEQLSCLEQQLSERHD